MPTSFIVTSAELAREFARGWLADPLSWCKAVLIDETDDGIRIDAFYDALLESFLDGGAFAPELRARLRELLASSGGALFIQGAGDRRPWVSCSRANADATAAINALLEAAASLGPPKLAESLHAQACYRNPLSIEFGAEYRATIRALLPRFRQVELDGEFELPGRLFVPAAASDFAPFGQQWYFTVSLCLMLQSFLIRHGITLPVAILDSVIDGLDTDWRHAVWRMIMGTVGPVFVAARERNVLSAAWDTLTAIDWAAAETQIARVRQHNEGAWGITGVPVRQLIKQRRDDR